MVKLLSACYPSSIRWRFLGCDVASDFAGSAIPPGNGGPVAVEVRRASHDIPGGGVILRDDAGAPSIGRPRVSVRAGDWGLVYEMEGTGRFWIEAAGRTVWYELASGALPGDVDHLMCGPVLGLAFQLQGMTLLHAGAVSVGGAALAFSGPHGVGKSTLSSSLVGAGYPLITDDILGLRVEAERWHAVQSVPRLKLWEDSAAATLDADVPTTSVLSWANKRRLRVGTDWGTVAPESLPLGAIYFLNPARDSSTPMAVEALPVRAATIALMGGMYSADLLSGPRAARTLDAATRIAEKVPVRVITYHRSFENLPNIREAILRDFEEVSCG